jgi:dTDP-4-dehydrorhamnose reductase
VRVGLSAIEAVPSTAHAAVARRPLNSRLDTRKVRQAFDIALPPWQHGLDRVVTEWFDRI